MVRLLTRNRNTLTSKAIEMITMIRLSVILVFGISVLIGGEEPVPWPQPKTTDLIVSGPGIAGLPSTAEVLSFEYLPDAKILPLNQFAQREILDHADQMGFLIGYWMVQTEVLKACARQRPDLAQRARLASIDFANSFGASVVQAAAIFDELSKGKMNGAAIRENVFAEADKALASTDPNVRQVGAWRRPQEYPLQQWDLILKEIEQRLKGGMDDRSLLAFCRFHPTLRLAPEKSLTEPFVRIWRSDDHPKAKGLRILMRYPGGWISKEGERDGVVQKFTSPVIVDGLGVASIMVQVKSLPELPAAVTIQSLFDDPEVAAEWIPKGAIKRTERTIDMARTAAHEIRYHMVQTRPDFSMRMECITWMLMSGKCLVVLTASVGNPKDDPSASFERLKPLFLRVAGNFDIQSAP